MNTTPYLQGKVALVTGGATGIGEAVARRFVALGAQVGIMGRRADVLNRLADEIGAIALPGDVADQAAAQHAVDTLVARCGGLDILVNNAGTAVLGSVEEIDEAQWQAVMDVNVNGPLRMSRAAIPQLRKRGGGAIVNIASVGAIGAAKHLVSYTTTKAAILGLTRSMARDLGVDNIRVNTLCPGWVDTAMTDGPVQLLSHIKGISADEARLMLVQHNPIQRMAQPDEIARCVEFLATDASSFVTGAMLVADGGQTIVDLGSLAYGDFVPV
jgi:meso-butanediol dehydrogenase/(S,S)-butanediol dehydrogenase/diacetyl reductase